MGRYLLLLLGVTICLILALLSSGAAPPQDRAAGSISLDPHRWVLEICCCDTCKIPPGPKTNTMSLIISSVTIVPRSASDSAWISLLPDTLRFNLTATGPAKKVTLNWPGVKIQGGKGHVLKGM